jgi:hypothetical protein
MARIRPVGMFGIKLVGPAHAEFSFFGKDGKPALMNFPNSPEGRRLAIATPLGHKSLVYLIHPVMRFWTAIEYIRWDPNVSDLLEDGLRAATAQDAVALIEAQDAHYSRYWRCIRILASIDNPMNGAPLAYGFNKGEVMREISQREYDELYNSLPWSWPQDSH